MAGTNIFVYIYIYNNAIHSICNIAGDLAVCDASKKLEKDNILDYDDEQFFQDIQPEDHEFNDPMMKAAGNHSDEDLDPALHSGWLFVDSDSDDGEP